MDITEWMREQEAEISCHVEDSIRSKEFEMFGYCSQSFLGGRPAKQYTSPLAVGDTVRVVGPECKGLVGELKVIDPNNDEAGDFYGVRFDGVDGYIFFREDEIRRVENVDIAKLPF